MPKDDLKSGEYCPDCIETEDDFENSEDCCGCCCSCVDSAPQSEMNSDNHLSLSLEQQKKDILSNLTISRTNRERASLHHVLQFVEALTHSSDFLRGYNLREDFCVECFISEPVCTCCDGISQLNLNDPSSGSCEECQNEDHDHLSHTLQDCPDCATSPAQQRRINRRQRRRRRNRNIRHSLPRVSTRAFSSGPCSANNCQQRNPSEKHCCGEKDCRKLSPNQAKDGLQGDCEDCIREGQSCARNRCGRRKLSGTFCGDSNDCEDCARGNSSSSFSCCGDREDNRHSIGNSSSDDASCSYSSNEASKDKPIKRNVPVGVIHYYIYRYR